MRVCFQLCCGASTDALATVSVPSLVILDGSISIGEASGLLMNHTITRSKIESLLLLRSAVPW